MGQHERKTVNHIIINYKCVHTSVYDFLLDCFFRCCFLCWLVSHTIYLSSLFLEEKVQKSFICVCKPFAIYADLSKRNTKKGSHLPNLNLSLKLFFSRRVLTPLIPFKREKNYIVKRGPCDFLLFYSVVVLLATAFVLVLLLLLLLLLSFQNALCVYLSFGWAYVLYIWYNRAGRRKRFGLQNNPIAERWRSCFSFIVCSFFPTQPLDNRYGQCDRKVVIHIHKSVKALQFAYFYIRSLI